MSRTERHQQRILALSRRIARRNTENADDAREIAALGCDCEVVGGGHLDTCPVQIAYDASRAGLYEPEGVASTVSNSAIDVPCFTEPFRKAPTRRVACLECRRYARSWGEIRHRKGCRAAGGGQLK